jgi:hypothetical protein
VANRTSLERNMHIPPYVVVMKADTGPCFVALRPPSQALPVFHILARHASPNSRPWAVSLARRPRGRPTICTALLVLVRQGDPPT